MKKVKGKIILVDDESYEQDFLEMALTKKDWSIQIEFFKSVDEAVEHLKQNADEVFLIISDIEMPKKSGMDFKKLLNEDSYLSQKSIPFIFVSNSLSRETVIQAYKYNVQGYFQKPMTPGQQSEMFEIIIQYWITCIHPNKDDLPENPNFN
ncbi:MAG: response regulator receiver protein [Bacteroidetes bacterium]|jgi:DNA-binding NtrC family response regulator|nr:response regulator receiver protein [Bacteroidota bacterium]